MMDRLPDSFPKGCDVVPNLTGRSQQDDRFANRSGLPAGVTRKKRLTVTLVIIREVRSAEKKNGVPASNDFLPLRPPKADTKEQHINEAQKTG